MRVKLFKTGDSVILILLIIFFFLVTLSGQENKTDENEKLREEILTVYKSGGEKSLIDYFKKNQDEITKKFIGDLAKFGLNHGIKEWLHISEVMAGELKDEKTLADVCFRIGEYFRLVSEYKKAFKYFGKSLSLYLKLNFLVGQGNVYHRKGEIYLINNNKKAKEMFDNALILFEKSKYSQGLGNTYLSLGRYYIFLRDNLKSIEMHNKALDFFKETNDIRGLGNVFLGKGVVYFETGYIDKSLEMFKRALPFFEKVRDLVGLGNVYRGEALIFSETYIFNKALEMYKKANFFYKESGDLLGRANVFHGIGVIYFHLGNNSNAFDMYNKSKNLFKKVGDILGQGNVCLSEGEIHSRLGDDLNALKMFEKALTFFVESGDIENEYYAIYEKAKIFKKQKKTDHAKSLFEKSILYMEKVRTQNSFDGLKMSYMEKVLEQYREVVSFLLDNGYLKKGFKYAESMRARVFLDRMAEGLVSLEKGLKPELKEQRDNLVGKLSAISKRMQETGAKEEKKLKELKTEYRKVESEFEDLLIKIRLDNPLYAQVRYPQPITVKELQKDVLKEGEVLVRYFISPEKLYVFLVSKESFKVVPIKVKEKVVNGIVTLYSQALKENNYRRIIRYGNKLYRELFQPLEEYLKGSREIIIVPDGDLATIPFESFVVDRNSGGKPVYLIEKYRLKYIQSASILTVLRKHYQRDGNRNSFVGFGDPVYDYENYKKGLPEQGSDIRSPKRSDEIWELHHDRYARQGGVLNRLRGSGESVKAIAGLFEKHNQKSVINLREQATEENAKGAGMKDFDFIHFACHGLLNEDFQSLVLSQLPPDKSQEDGYFTLNEIMNCDYNARLVVLSACQTGSGKMERGEGVTGLTRAVMYAGTPAVVASLWDVDDRATKELMVSFYRNMLEKNLDKVEALRQAKLELLKNEKYASPLYWSAFVLYGE